MKLLDCTLRDGGYYTAWDFSPKLSNTYFEVMNQLPIDYLEIGYRSRPLPGYYGEYFYLPVSLLKAIREKTTKELVIILNEKDVRIADLPDLLGPLNGIVSMVRLAIQPENLSRAKKLAIRIKEKGFEVSFNVMYMSSWGQVPNLIACFEGVEEVADYLYMVDSYGGVMPEDVIKTIELVRRMSEVPLGFHGHNNLELALINTITALTHGVTIVDSTITGMGRGAGNLKTELLLTYLNQKQSVEIDFNALSTVVKEFSDLQHHYGWGTNLPYMVSGANSLPQKEVMEWVTKRFYPLNSIVRALNNQKNQIADNLRLPIFEPNTEAETCFIIGGGPSAFNVASYLKKWLEQHGTTCLIHASSRNVSYFKELPAEHYFCLVGNEGNRLEKNYGNLKYFSGTCVLPPYPRKMGSVVPEQIKEQCYELAKVDFTDKIADAHTSLALQTAKELGFKQVFVIGYDGYANETLTPKEQELFVENNALFKDAIAAGIELISLTPSRYSALTQSSIFSKI